MNRIEEPRIRILIGQIAYAGKCLAHGRAERFTTVRGYKNDFFAFFQQLAHTHPQLIHRDGLVEEGARTHQPSALPARLILERREQR